MESIKNIEHLDKIEEYVYKCISKDELDLVQLFERLETYCNLKTIPNYAKDNNISYNGAKKCRDVVNLFGVKFILDKD
ncbi:MAG: hypothetical protein HRU18_11265 [Pseudoalteromonas sp.]|uniref:hypothetical protein n=1 Tax=Pseudoalteromonas sp. TaxID=53249 RepID=UPI001D5293DF|nr:hypothetical protein [Pseudoalteromonas sp.]NRA78779.1 hypothetical protein [Pseudoalteromonas sp.]